MPATSAFADTASSRSTPPRVKNRTPGAYKEHTRERQARLKFIEDQNTRNMRFWYRTRTIRTLCEDLEILTGCEYVVAFANTSTGRIHWCASDGMQDASSIAGISTDLKNAAVKSPYFKPFHVKERKKKPKEPREPKEPKERKKRTRKPKGLEEPRGTKKPKKQQRTPTDTASAEETAEKPQSEQNTDATASPKTSPKKRPREATEASSDDAPPKKPKRSRKAEQDEYVPKKKRGRPRKADKDTEVVSDEEPGSADYNPSIFYQNDEDDEYTHSEH